MKNEEQEIKRFYSDLRKSEMDQMNIPDFEELVDRPRRNRSIIRWMLPLGMAASLVALFFLVGPGGNSSSAVHTDLEIVIMEGDNSTETDHILYDTDVSMLDQWKSPTGSLINDFN